MIKEYELNKAYAEKLSILMANHPDMRVIAWIDTDGISDDYAYLAGNIYEPHIETLIIGKDDNMYYEKEDSPYDDCCHYYGWKEVDNWSDEEIEEKAKAIPWEDVIAVRVGVN